MLFDALLTLVFEDIVFNPEKLFKNLFRAYFAQKVLFGKLWAM
jgi:hypothetical protein